MFKLQAKGNRWGLFPIMDNGGQAPDMYWPGPFFQWQPPGSGGPPATPPGPPSGHGHEGGLPPKKRTPQRTGEPKVLNGGLAPWFR